jgi:hypothetical protein
MQILRCTSVHLLVLAAAFGLLEGARAEPPAARAEASVTAPAPDPGLVARDSRARAPGDAPARCRQATAHQPAAARPVETATAGLGGTRCWWQCWPGSGCQYTCQFYPQ